MFLSEIYSKNWTGIISQENILSFPHPKDEMLLPYSRLSITRIPSIPKNIESIQPKALAELIDSKGITHSHLSKNYWTLNEPIDKKKGFACHMMIGIPGSGKTTLSQKLFRGLHLVSRDLHGRYAEEKLLKQFLSEGKSVVIDDTNYNKKTRQNLINLIKPYKASIKGIYVYARLVACLERNIKRKKAIPAVGLRGLANKFETPSIDEGFDSLQLVNNDTV
ncbi:MAG TPA: AAA family ATPase [Candidatus Nanoarchaeia archaeon]|nr:AAA family ATPase [Candidatus Nanoarchaeia archaeon]